MSAQQPKSWVAEAYSEYRPSLFCVALALTANAEMAEDLVQRTIVKALEIEANPDKENPKHVRAWLVTVLTNRYYDDKKLWSERNIEHHAEPPEPDVEQNSAEAESLWWQNVTLEMVKAAVAELPPSLRVPYELAKFHNWKYAQIHKHLLEVERDEIEEGTVGTRIGSAKKKLIAILKRNIK